MPEGSNLSTPAPSLARESRTWGWWFAAELGSESHIERRTHAVDRSGDVLLNLVVSIAFMMISEAKVWLSVDQGRALRGQRCHAPSRHWSRRRPELTQRDGVGSLIVDRPTPTTPTGSAEKPAQMHPPKPEPPGQVRSGRRSPHTHMRLPWLAGRPLGVFRLLRRW